MQHNNVSICEILLHREVGYRARSNKINNHVLVQLASYLAENSLLDSLSFEKTIKTVHEVTDDSRSIFTIEYSSDGKVATSHTNRSVSIFKVSNMKRIAKIDTNERTIWTMSFHPTENILATGSLGGICSVYKNYKLYRQSREHISRKPVASMCFHPTEFYICLATSKRLILWDWENETILSIYETHPLCTIRYLRFNPSNSLLITGISKIPNNLIFLSKDPSFIQYFVPKTYITIGYLWIFLLATNYILEYLESNKFDNDEKILSNSNTWNFIMKLIIQQNHVREDESTEGYPSRSLNTTLSMFINRLKEIEEDCAQQMPENYQAFNWDEITHRHARDSKHYFESINYSLVEDKNDDKYVLSFDVKLVENIVNRMFKILYIVCDTKVLFDCDVDHYMKGEAMKPILVERSEKFESQYTLQCWDETENIDLTEDWRNVLTTSTIHNDPTISIAGKLIASFKTTLHYKCIEVRSLSMQNLGELKYIFKTNNENFLSLSISPSTRYLLIGIRSKHFFAHVLSMDKEKDMKIIHSLPNIPCSDCNINCLKWSMTASDGIIIGYKLYQLRYLRNF